MSYVALENSDQYSILMQSLRISYIFKSYSPLYHSLLDHLHLSTDLTLCFLKKKKQAKTSSSICAAHWSMVNLLRATL